MAGPHRRLTELIDEIDDILLTEQEVPPELVVEFLGALPDPERRRWIQTLVRMARRATGS